MYPLTAHDAPFDEFAMTRPENTPMAIKTRQVKSARSLRFRYAHPQYQRAIVAIRVLKALQPGDLLFVLRHSDGQADITCVSLCGHMFSFPFLQQYDDRKHWNAVSLN